MKKIKSINTTTFLNLCSTVLLQGISFITIPIFTRLLGTEQYGIYAVFSSWTGILMCVIGLGIRSSLATGIYEFKEKYYSFRSSILLSGTIVCLIIFAVIIVFAKPISGFLQYNYWMLFWLCITSFSQFVIDFVQGACVFEKNALLNVCLSVLLSVSTVVLSIILIIYGNDKYRFLSRIYGVGIPYIIVSIVVWILIYFKSPVNFNKVYYKYALVIGLPMVFHTLSQNILSQADRVMMQKLSVSNSEIGIYSFYYTFAGALSSILNALNTSWVPFYYDDLSEKAWGKLKRKCDNYLNLFTVITIGFLMLSKEVSKVMAGDGYNDGNSVLPIIVLAIYFTFLYQFAVNFELYHKKTKIIAIGTMGAAIVNIIFNAMFIPKYGMYGAAIATVISYIALFFVHYCIVTHLKNIKFHLKMIDFVPRIIIILCFTLLYYLLKNNILLRWGIAFCIGGIEILKIINRKSIF